jgi:hypothetical protein
MCLLKIKAEPVDNLLRMSDFISSPYASQIIPTAAAGKAEIIVCVKSESVSVHHGLPK